MSFDYSSIFNGNHILDLDTSCLLTSSSVLSLLLLCFSFYFFSYSVESLDEAWKAVYDFSATMELVPKDVSWENVTEVGECLMFASFFSSQFLQAHNILLIGYL